MASGFTIDRRIRVDARLGILGKKFKSDKHHALGKMTELWLECLEKQTYYLKSAVIDELTGIDGFAEMMCDSDPELALAEKREQGYYIKDVEGRIEWLGACQSNGKKGGRPIVGTQSQLELNEIKTGSKPDQNPDQTDAEPDQKHSSSTSSFNSNSKKKIKNIDHSSFDFVALYAKYPKHVGKQKGLEKCREQIKTQKDYDALSKAIDNYKAYKASSGELVAHFKTFMNDWHEWIDFDVSAEKVPVSKADFVEPILTAVKTISSGTVASSAEYEALKNRARTKVGDQAWKLVTHLGGWQKTHQIFAAQGEVGLTIRIRGAAKELNLGRAP